MNVALVKYDAACRALAEAKAIDEVKHIRDVAEAMRAYAKQAKNKQLEMDAAEIRIRAERRVGELMQAQRETVGLAPAGRYKPIGSDGDPIETPPTLAEAGIDKHLADRARKFAAVPAETFESEISEWRGRVAQEGERVSARLMHEGEKRIKVGPPSDGLQFARIAIMKLEEIRPNDVQRQQAFDMVRRWIDERQAKAAMHA
ncbi:MAG: hypothetical protein NUW22_15675 [Acidobacteria bacterium]|nr:hypothetical protein [Acidobacteriota bacterium]